MIKLNRLFVKGILASLVFHPQLSYADAGVSKVGLDSITTIQINTMGMPPIDRARIICEDRQASKLCVKLLNEPDYRDLWLETADKLTQVEWMLAEKLVELRGQIDKDGKTVSYMIERAPKLPDGRAIFRAKDGQYTDINGNLVSAEVAATAK